MDNKACLEIVVYKPCLLKENVSSLINFVTLPEDNNALYHFSSEIIKFIHSSSAKGIFEEPIYIVFPPWKLYRSMRDTQG